MFCSEETANYHRWGKYHSPTDGLQVNALPTTAEQAQRFWGDWKLSGTKSTLLTLRMVRKNNNCLSFLDRVCRYMKINCSGQFVVDELSLEPSLPDFQAEPCLRHTSPCWRNPRPAKCSLLCPAARCCTQPPCTGPCLSTRFPNGQPRKKIIKLCKTTLE